MAVGANSPFLNSVALPYHPGAGNATWDKRLVDLRVFRSTSPVYNQVSMPGIIPGW